MKTLFTIFSLSLISLWSFATTDSKDSVKLGEVVVTGTRQATDIRHLPQTLSIVGNEKLRENERPNILPTLMEQVPGLMITNRSMMGYGVSTGGSGGMMLRGISSADGQVMVLIDGHPQYNGIYGHSIADAYQTMMTERVEVLRGPASMLYGSNAMGGVVNIVTRGMKQNGMITDINLGAGSWGTFQSEISNQFRHNRFSSTIAMQYARTDNHRPNMGFEQYGAYVKLNYDITDNWNAYADFDITHFNASYPGTKSTPMLEANQYITRGVFAVGIENHYKNTSGCLSFYDNFGRHKINDGYNPLKDSPQARLFRSNDALLGINWYQTASLWTGSRVTAGIDYQNIYGHAYYTSRATGEVLTTSNKQSGRKTNHEAAGYVDIRQDLLAWLTLDAGLRYDYHTVTKGEWIPQAGIVVRPLSTGEIKLMASKGFRNPTMREMYLYPPSNTDLRPERMWNYEIAWKQRLLNNRLQYGVNLFYIKADNIIQNINKKNINTGSLINKGVEIEAQYAINSHWSVNTNHSWLDMKTPVVGAPKYKGYLGTSVHYGKWNIASGITQVCGLCTIVAPTARKRNCTLMNATIGYQLTPAIRLWAKGDNLFAQRYEFIEGMPMPRATFMGGINITF